MFNEQLEEILIELYQKVSDGSLLFWLSVYHSIKMLRLTETLFS